MSVSQAPPGIALKLGIKTATDFVIFTENTLGWVAPVNDKTPLWKARAVEAGKINRQMKMKPRLVTFDNLVLAVEFCRVNKEDVKSPTSLCWRIESALKAAVQAGPSVIAMTIDDAISWEKQFPDERSEHWVGLLTRAQGPAREDVLTEWKAERNVRT